MVFHFLRVFHCILALQACRRQPAYRNLRHTTNHNINILEWVSIWAAQLPPDGMHIFIAFSFEASHSRGEQSLSPLSSSSSRFLYEIYSPSSSLSSSLHDIWDDYAITFSRRGRVAATTPPRYIQSRRRLPPRRRNAATECRIRKTDTMFRRDETGRTYILFSLHIYIEKEDIMRGRRFPEHFSATDSSFFQREALFSIFFLFSKRQMSI